jgi:hypothetical protein
MKTESSYAWYSYQKKVHNYKQREEDLVTIVNYLGLKFEQNISIIDKTKFNQSLELNLTKRNTICKCMNNCNK